MNIIIIGSGNVAWNMAKLCVAAGHEIQQIVSRNAETATALAYEVNTESANYFSILQTDADIYIICVNDDAIADIVSLLPKLAGLVVHTSGALDSELLANTSANYGVLYPLQSLVYGAKEIPPIPFLILGNNEATEKKILKFAKTLSPLTQVVSGPQKMQMHIAAVFANNFTNHMLALAQQWCNKNNLDFNLLQPLIAKTFENSRRDNIAALQTGPAIRKDRQTIAFHEALLAQNSFLLNIYKELTNNIILTSYAK